MTILESVLCAAMICALISQLCLESHIKTMRADFMELLLVHERAIRALTENDIDGGLAALRKTPVGDRVAFFDPTPCDDILRRIGAL